MSTSSYSFKSILHAIFSDHEYVRGCAHHGFCDTTDSDSCVECSTDGCNRSNLNSETSPNPNPNPEHNTKPNPEANETIQIGSASLLVLTSIAIVQFQFP